MGPTSVKGNSRARAGPEAKSFALFFAGADPVSSGLSSEGILSEPRERLRIQPRSKRDKRSDAERHGLRVAHDGTRRFAGRLEPGVHDDTEIIVERRNDVEHGEDREHGMLCFDERKKNKVLAHEAGGRRNAGKRKHEDQQQKGRRGTALVQAVQILEFFANETLLPQHDEDRKSARG